MSNADLKKSDKKKDDPQAKSLFQAVRVYRERGAFLHRLEQCDEARKSYDEAYNNDPENIPLLIKRSAVCIDSLDLNQAIEDANAALQLDPGNINALLQKSRALASMCEFETSVVINNRNVKRRQKPSCFIDGANSGLSSIADAIGKPAGQVLAQNLPTIKKSESKSLDEHEPEKVKHISRIPRTRHKTNITQTEAHKHTLLSRVLAYKYLGPMAYDKFFLQDLARDGRIKSANSKGSEELTNLINKALNGINARQEILREQRPYYSIKQSEKSESVHQTEYKKKLIESERRINTNTAHRWVKQVEDCQRCRRINEMMEKAERMQLFLNSKTSYTLPEKESYIDRLYRAVGRGYLYQHRVSYKISERSNRRRIAFLMGLRVGRSSSFDSVLANYPYKFTDPNIVLAHTKAALEICENSTMRCWLYYELSKLSCSLKNFTSSKIYAKRCQNEAAKLDDPVWWLNGCFALMASDMQQGNVNEVKTMVEEANEWLSKSKDSEHLAAFLRKCAEMVVDLGITDESKAIEVREKKILNVLDNDMREDAKVLFRRMSKVPYGRRFSVLPRKNEVKQSSERRKHQQRHLSIIPGPDIILPLTSRTPIPGLQIFTE